ncbi:MAG: octaprenyl diphosphate synthase [Gammaproteobacteria bacterium]|nr:octaprenyl diphosphate synthase [Gammaproteobacteria bacterium]
MRLPSTLTRPGKFFLNLFLIDRKQPPKPRLNFNPSDSYLDWNVLPCRAPWDSAQAHGIRSPQLAQSRRRPSGARNKPLNATHNPPELESLRALLAADMAAVDRCLKSRLQSDVTLISQLGTYIIAGGGKRLRPALALLAAKATGYEGSQHIDVAVIIELVHTATLLHDDVVDASKMRRGRETANLIWGNEASVLVGDFLYSRAFQMMVKLRNLYVLEILAEATNVIAEGEVMQLVSCHNPDISEDRYLDTIRFKTAKLFEAAARLGVVIAAGEIEHENALSAYGRHLGTAFQLVDDALDYSADPEQLGKNLGDDLAEGKPTLPLLYAMWCGTSTQAAAIRYAIEHGGRDRITEITQAIESTGAINYTLALAEKEAAEAQAALSIVRPSAYLDALKGLARFAVQRGF